jgi:protein TonB
MKNIIVAFIVMAGSLLISNSTFGQEKVSQPQTDSNIGKEIFMIVEKMPEFPGGEKARQKFLAQNLLYPAEAKEKNIEGTVYASFILEVDGTVSNINIIKGLGYGLDEEVVRVLKMMPAWRPGKQKGVPVRVKINLPVKFIIK